MDIFISKFMGRNYHLALLIVLLSYTLCLFGHMTGQAFATLAAGIFGSFRAGDAVVNWIHRDKHEPSDSPPSEPSPCQAPFALTGKEDENDRPA